MNIDCSQCVPGPRGCSGCMMQVFMEPGTSVFAGDVIHELDIAPRNDEQQIRDCVEIFIDANLVPESARDCVVDTENPSAARDMPYLRAM